MTRKVVKRGAKKGELVEVYEDLGPGRAVLAPVGHTNRAGGGSHIRGTKKPPSTTGVSTLHR